jgi:hypothetical protein
VEEVTKKPAKTVSAVEVSKALAAFKPRVPISFVVAALRAARSR